MSSNQAAEPVVACQNVTRTYERGHQRRGRLSRTSQSRPSVTALDGVNLSVAAGEIVGVKGPSGSGKSTLLHLLSALETPTDGQVTIEGRSTSALSAAERARLRLEAIGIVFQRFHLLSALPALSNVALPLVEAGVPKAERRNRASAVLHRVGLGQRQSHTPGKLSGGEQQRVAIARALITGPTLLIADEPTGELDTTTGEQILDLFADAAADGTAVVIASHDDDALDIADRVIELRDGTRIDA